MGSRAQRRGWPWGPMVLPGHVSLLSIYLSNCLSLHPSTRPSDPQSARRMPVSPSVCLLIHSFAHLSSVPSTCLVAAVVLDARVQ